MKVRLEENGNAIIHCPACDEWHVLNVSQQNDRPRWSFNGDLEKPTFAPSLLVRQGHYVTGKPKEECYVCSEKETDGFKCYICHSFINNGMIQFLGDCTHELAGQTVPLKDVELRQ